MDVGNFYGKKECKFAVRSDECGGQEVMAAQKTESYVSKQYEAWMPLFAKVGFEELQWGRANIERIYDKEKGAWVADGVLQAFFPNGKVNHHAHFRRNLLHGKCTIYREDGSKSSEVDYTDGHTDGFRRTWHTNGRIKSEEKLLRNRIAGDCKYWSNDGTLERHRYLDEEGNVLDAPAG